MPEQGKRRDRDRRELPILLANEYFWAGDSFPDVGPLTASLRRASGAGDEVSRLGARGRANGGGYIYMPLPPLDSLAIQSAWP
jgi:hypothetical protein